MNVKAAVVALIVGGLAAAVGSQYWPQQRQAAAAKPGSKSALLLPADATTVQTKHYLISSTAAPAQTTLVANAVESLHGAYTAFFRGLLPRAETPAKLQLVLYKNQQQFKTYNRSRPWAEAYYRAPISHAYYAQGDANPYHWMVHEATHQLNFEVAHFPKAKWIDEGLASYFGTSKIEGRRLQPGAIDPNTYPIWWLSSLALSGDLQADISQGRIIPLRALITDTGPAIGLNVNLYYIEYWSLSHFLFHHEHGRHARKYRELIVQGSSIEKFEALFGPIEQVQRDWYQYLRRKVDEVKRPQ